MRAERPRGFILPTTLLVLTLLTVMLTAAFVLISAEYRSTDNAMAGTRAQALGEAALQTYFATPRGKKATDWYDSVRYNYTGGYADVVARKMIMATTGQTSWVVRSVGTSTDPLLTGMVTARRTIAQMGSLNPAAALSPRAAMVALNGVGIIGPANQSNPLNGASISSGVPGCNSPIGSLADTLALVTPAGGYTGSTPNGGSSSSGSVNLVYDSTHVDWSTVLAGNFTPDYVGAAGIPSPGNTTWAVGYIQGDVTIPSNPGSLVPTPGSVSPRVGILIVTGDVTMANNASWAGMMIVGGRIIGTGNFWIRGYTVTGLNCATGGSCVANSYNKWSGGSSFREIRWSWCYANLSVDLLGAMVPVKNAFIDNWAAY